MLHAARGSCCASCGPGCGCSVPGCLDLSNVRDSERGLFRVTLAPEAEPVAPGLPVAMRVAILGNTGPADCGIARIGLDGGMPQQGLRWPGSAAVSPVASGGWRIADLVFARPGWWLLRLRIEAAAGTDTVTFNFIVASASG